MSIKPTDDVLAVSIKPTDDVLAVSIKPNDDVLAVSIKLTDVVLSVPIKPADSVLALSIKPTDDVLAVSIKMTEGVFTVSITPNDDVLAVSIKTTDDVLAMSIKMTEGVFAVSIQQPQRLFPVKTNTSGTASKTLLGSAMTQPFTKCVRERVERAMVCTQPCIALATGCAGTIALTDMFCSRSWVWPCWNICIKCTLYYIFIARYLTDKGEDINTIIKVYLLNLKMIYKHNIV